MVEQAVLALLFGDLAVVGTGRLVRDLDRAGWNSLGDDDRAAVLSQRFPEVESPVLAREVSELEELAGGDPLKMLENGVARDVALTAPRETIFPVAAFARRDRAVPVELGFVVADSHLHSGATVSLEVLIRSLGSTVSAPGRKSLAGRHLWTMTGQQ